MPNKQFSLNLDKKELEEKLYQKYGHSRSFKNRFIFWRKKYSWLLIVKGAKLFKRVFDIIFSLLLLILLSPLMLLIAITIKLTDGGPIFYVTNRIGKWGIEFRFPKFRSMKLGAHELKKDLMESSKQQEITFKLKEDPRVTSIGKIIRRLSLDELPQLWCVLKGEMSLVGPRPPLPEEVALYSLEQRRRLEITPGLTCIWQVSGRSELPFSKQVQLDVEYIESQSLWLDIKLLLKTIPAVIFGKGAY